MEEKQDAHPADHQIHAECKGKFDFNDKEHQHFWEHLKDGEGFRADVIKLKENQITIFRGLDKVGRIPWMILGSTGITLVGLLAACLWVGRYIERIDTVKDNLKEHINTTATKHGKLALPGDNAYADEK